MLRAPAALERVAQALARPKAAGRTYELGGPRTYRYRELLKLILRQTGRRRLLLHLPFLVWNTLAALLSPLPKPPISRDQVTLMKEDNVVGPDVGTLRDLSITPTPLEAILPAHLKRQ
jgi:NADH dehydrogenase